MRQRLGCLSGTGLIAALITALAIAGYVYARGGLLFNAGPLNAQSGRALGGVASHAEIGGNCESCHTAPWESETMADRCVVCHTDIATELQSVESLHGTIMHNNPVACRDCHPEHRGPAAPLLSMEDATFPHEAVGFSLNGHQRTSADEPFTCDDCHQDDITTFTTDTCHSCHLQIDPVFSQAHLSSFGIGCLVCHDGVDRYGDDFDHNQFGFRLTGKHAEVSCSGCHQEAHTIAELQSAPQDCFSCHRQDEPHEGRFGQDCAECHSTDGWSPAEFDHNLSVFKLEGAHAEVPCESCHINRQFRGTPMDCFSCHQPEDAHNGRFGTDCAACHNPSDWSDADFDHNLSAFPLTGRHAELACEQCHSSGQFAGLSTTCVSCHAEPAFHAGLFGTDCAACHSTTAWTPAEFNGQHAFPLNHGGGATCATCHSVSFTSYTCYGCHEHEEAEVVERHLDKEIFNFQNCMACHPTGEKD